MKKIGKINLIEENTCDFKCDCGWNITIGGEDKEDLDKIKEFLKRIK